jgi:chromosomal replication initiator protein
MSFAPTISMIQERVAVLFGVRRADLLGKTRVHTVTRPRHVAMHLARELTERSFPEIGRAFRRDHTSVMYAVRIMPECIRRDAALRAKVERLRADLGQAGGAR